MGNLSNLKKGRLRDIYVLMVFFMILFGVVVVAAQVGPKNLFVAVTLGNTAPVVFFPVTGINGTVTLTDGGLTTFFVAFNVTDADGTGNINNAGVGVNITFNGVKRSNNSGNCVNLGDSSSTTRLFSCNITFNYFDNSTSLWDINLSAADSNGGKAHNDSQSPGTNSSAHNLTVSSLSAFTLQTTNVVSAASLGDVNKELTIVVNNTGNFDFTVLNVTPFNLNASITDIFALNGNFSINATSSTASGFGDNLQNATPRNFTESNNQISATLPHKITSANDNIANRTLYIYIDVPSNKGLSSGVTYNVSPSSPWQLFAS